MANKKFTEIEIVKMINETSMELKTPEVVSVLAITQPVLLLNVMKRMTEKAYDLGCQQTQESIDKISSGELDEELSVIKHK